MMRFFHFHDARDYRFARASGGRTLDSMVDKPCPECSASRVKFKPPFVLEWEPGSDIIGDFTLPGFDDAVIVTDRVKKGLLSRFHGFELQVIEFRQDPKLKKPSSVTKRTLPRVWLPYEGPPLWELWITSWCHLDRVKSGIILEKTCSTCGRDIYTRPASSSPYRVIDITTWNGEDIFHVHESPRWLFCTEKVKSYIEESGFSNIHFIEDGIIPY